MKKFLLYLTFLYTIQSNFNIQTFLSSSQAQGIKLYAQTSTDTANGYLIVTGNTMAVTLYDSPTMSSRANVLSVNLLSFKTMVDQVVSSVALSITGGVQ